MDSKNLFEIKFATQHSLDIGIVAPKSGNVDMQLMTDRKVSDFVTKKSYHAVTVVSNYHVKATSDTVSVDPFCCSSNSLLLDTDVLRCELCVIPQHYLRPNNVLFDGYPGGLSTKNNSHLRWKESSSSNLSYSQQSK